MKAAINPNSSTSLIKEPVRLRSLYGMAAVASTLYHYMQSGCVTVFGVTMTEATTGSIVRLLKTIFLVGIADPQWYEAHLTYSSFCSGWKIVAHEAVPKPGLFGEVSTLNAE